MNARITSGFTMLIGSCAFAAAALAQQGPPPITVANFPENQNVTVTNEVLDVAVVSAGRVQVSITAENNGSDPPEVAPVELADGDSFTAVPTGMKLVLTDFIIRLGVQDSAADDDDDFLANIGRADVTETCDTVDPRRLQFRVFKRDQIIASLATGLEYFEGEQVCISTGTPGDSPDNIGLSYQIIGYLTDDL